VYFEEEQEAYTDSNGFRIGSQTFELGSLDFGPTFSYRIQHNDMTITPLIGIKGIYDFKAPDIFDVNGLAIGVEDELRAQLKLGLNVQTLSGVTIEANYTHESLVLGRNLCISF